MLYIHHITLRIDYFLLFDRTLSTYQIIPPPEQPHSPTGPSPNPFDEMTHRSH